LIMRSYGIPSKIINVVKALYADFECAVVDGHDTTEWFKIKRTWNLFVISTEYSLLISSSPSMSVLYLLCSTWLYGPFLRSSNFKTTLAR